MHYHKIALTVLGTVLILGIGCAKQAPKSKAPVVPIKSAEDVGTDTVVVRLGEQNNSGESGVAYFYPEDGKTKVSLEVAGALAGIDQPAHIHTGSCAHIGGVVYPLNSAVNGKSDTVINISTDELLNQLPLALNVHKSKPESATYVACGDITKAK